MALDGVTDSGVSVALDVLRAANALSARFGLPAPFSVRVVGARGPTVTTAAGIVLRVGGTLRQLQTSDVVLVPGCWTEAPEDVDRLLARDDVARVATALRRAHDRGVIVGASCTGSFVLAAAGLLDGRKATTTWWLADVLRARYPCVDVTEHQTLIVDGTLLCAGTVFAMADLALAVVARVAGPILAHQCMKVLLLDEHPSQAPYMALRQTTTDEPGLREAEAYARRHLARGVSVSQLARAAGMSTRTFARRVEAALGTTPLGFIQRLRLETATHLLETSPLSLSEIAARVGYRDAGTLRRLLRDKLDVAPRQLRRTRPAA